MLAVSDVIVERDHVATKCVFFLVASRRACCGDFLAQQIPANRRTKQYRSTYYRPLLEPLHLAFQERCSVVPVIVRSVV